MSTTIVAAVLALNALLHVVYVARFGMAGNTPFFVYIFVYSALAAAVYLTVPYALWATLILGAVGVVGLATMLGKLTREKSLALTIWALDIVGVAGAAYLLLLA